jgi:hypothetical protein
MEGCPVIFTAGKFTMSLLYATAFTLLRLFFLMGEVAMGARRCCCCLERYAFLISDVLISSGNGV